MKTEGRESRRDREKGGKREKGGELRQEEDEVGRKGEEWIRGRKWRGRNSKEERGSCINREKERDGGGRRVKTGGKEGWRKERTGKGRANGDMRQEEGEKRKEKYHGTGEEKKIRKNAE